MPDPAPPVDPPAPPAPPPAPPAPPAPVVDPEKGFENALKKMNGDATRLARRFYNDSLKDREKIRELSSKVVPEGAVILAGDELKAFQALKALGKKPEEIATILQEHGELKATEAKRTIATQRQEYAELHGYDPEVLGKLLDDANIEIEIQEPPGPNGQPQRGRDGKPYRVAMVKEEDPKDKRKSLFTALPDYAAKHWPKFLPALKAGSSPAPTAPRPNGNVTPSNAPPSPPVPPAPPAKLHGGRNPF